MYVTQHAKMDGWMAKQNTKLCELVETEVLNCIVTDEDDANQSAKNASNDCANWCTTPVVLSWKEFAL